MTPVLDNSNGVLTFSAGQWRCPETAGVLLGLLILEVCATDVDGDSWNSLNRRTNLRHGRQGPVT